MTLVQRAIAALLSMATAGCLTTKNIAPDQDTTMTANQGIAVIGLSSGAKGLFYAGDFRDGLFKPDGLFPKGLSLASGEPYIIQKAEVTTVTRRYGLESITLGDRTLGIGCNQDLPVLSIQQGVAQYFGDFTLVQEGQSLKLRHTFDLARAQAYIDKAYPSAHWRLQRGDFVLAKTPECPKGPALIYIPVPAFH